MTVAFVLVAVVIAAVAIVVLSVRSREPGSIDAGIRSFRREMDALAPRRPQDPPRRPDDDPS